IGVQSWAQLIRTGANPRWGSEFESITVSDNSGTLFNQSFTNGNYAWRNVVMTNGDGVNWLNAGTAGVPVGEIAGNFGIDVDDPWVNQNTNGFLYGSTAT